MKCESCNGSGKYIGFSNEENCKDCLGKGIIDTSINKSSFIKMMLSLSENSLMECAHNLTDKEKIDICWACEILRYYICVEPRV